MAQAKALGDITESSHQVVPHHLQVSRSDFLHCAYILLLLFLFHFSTTYLVILLVPRVSGCPGVISGVVSGVLCPTHALWHQEGVIVAMAFPLSPGLHSTRLLVISG